LKVERIRRWLQLFRDDVSFLFDDIKWRKNVSYQPKPCEECSKIFNIVFIYFFIYLFLQSNKNVVKDNRKEIVQNNITSLNGNLRKDSGGETQQMKQIEKERFLFDLKLKFFKLLRFHKGKLIFQPNIMTIIEVVTCRTHTWRYRSIIWGILQKIKNHQSLHLEESCWELDPRLKFRGLLKKKKKIKKIFKKKFFKKKF